MGRPSIVPDLTRKLEAVLVRLTEAYLEQPGPDRTPTLPLVHGKVNVRKLAEMAGFEGRQEQHIFKDAALRDRVNAAAVAQGVDEVGSHGPAGEDDAVAVRLRRVTADRSELAQALAEREAVIERLRREIDALREQLALLEESGMPMRLREVR